LPAIPQAKPNRPAAKPVPEGPTTYPIRSISIEGNRNYTEEQVLHVAGLKIGQTGDAKTFEAARDRLVASGAFETVGFRYGPSDNGYSVVFEVTEIQQVYPFVFEYVKAPEAEIRAWLKQNDPLYTDKIPGTKQWIARYAEMIEAFLKQSGLNQKITGELTTEHPNELHIMFRPAGAMPVVAEVVFTGSKVIPEGSLRETIRGVAIGSRFTETRFRQLLDTSIRPLYEARGRVRVSFPKVTSEQARGDVKGVKVTVEVDEGETYNLGEVQVEGTASMNKELLQVAGLKIGDLANFHEVEMALQRINAHMRQDGYMKVTSKPERRIDDEKKTVDLVLAVDPGPQYRFGKLEVKGLDINGEHEVRRIWGLKQGEPFRGNYPDYFLQQVREQGVFDQLGETSSQTSMNDKDLTVDVTLTFKIAPPPKKVPGAP
jgi:outer membrane protein assembly factor BamA